MGCGCQGAKKRSFEHVALDGKVTEVATQQEAVRLVRVNGGTWRMKKK